MVDPRQVRPDPDGILRCTQCGLAYELAPREAAAALREYGAALVAAVTETPEPGRDQRPDARTWSVNGYAAHAADVAGVLTARMRQVLDEDSPELDGYDEDRVARRGGFDDVPARESTVLLVERVADAALVLDGVATGDDAERLWRRAGAHPSQGEVALWQVACDLVHELHHHTGDVVGVAGRVEASARGTG